MSNVYEDAERVITHKNNSDDYGLIVQTAISGVTKGFSDAGWSLDEHQALGDRLVVTFVEAILGNVVFAPTDDDD